MTDMVNGKDNGPLAGWVIAQTNGLTLVGKDVNDARTDADMAMKLSPVLNMQPNLVQGQGGGVAPIHPCFPVFLLDVREIEVPEGSVIVSCESLSKAQRAQLWKFVEQGLAILEQMRLASSGLTVARTMPKVGNLVKG
jgi:hypothetical protein